MSQHRSATDRQLDRERQTELRLNELEHEVDTLRDSVRLLVRLLVSKEILPLPHHSDQPSQQS
jgi:hypothetical protein